MASTILDAKTCTFVGCSKGFQGWRNITDNGTGALDIVAVCEDHIKDPEPAPIVTNYESDWVDADEVAYVEYYAEYRQDELEYSETMAAADWDHGYETD